MVRAMIVLLLLGSGFLGWNYFQQAKVLERYEKDLADDGVVDESIRETQDLAHKYAGLLARAETEGIGEDDEDAVLLNVRKIATLPAVLWGNIESNKPKSSGNRKGYSDNTYAIRHTEAKYTVTRDRVANFFFKLEDQWPKYKITGISMRPKENVKEAEIPNDEWIVTLDVTHRTKEEKGKKKR